jgi:hypothetical protein
MSLSFNLSDIPFSSVSSPPISSSFLDIAEYPTFSYPASTPKTIGCLYPLDPCSSLIVNGVLPAMVAFLAFNSCLALRGEVGMSGFPCRFNTQTFCFPTMLSSFL